MLETINARSQDSMHEQSFRKAIDCDKMMNKGVDAYLNKMLLVGRVDNSWRGKGADPTAPSLQLLTSCRKSRCKFAPRRECPVLYLSQKSSAPFSMGSSTSKAAKTAADAARRQYPQRVPPPPSSNTPSATPPPAGQPTAPGPTVHPQSQISNTRDECELCSLISLLNRY